MNIDVDNSRASEILTMFQHVAGLLTIQLLEKFALIDLDFLQKLPFAFAQNVLGELILPL